MSEKKPIRIADEAYSVLSSPEEKVRHVLDYLEAEHERRAEFERGVLERLKKLEEDRGVIPPCADGRATHDLQGKQACPACGWQPATVGAALQAMREHAWANPEPRKPYELLGVTMTSAPTAGEPEPCADVSTCAGCKHWVSHAWDEGEKVSIVDSAGRAGCAAIGTTRESREEDPDERAVVEAYGHGDCLLRTRGDFGCVLFEAKVTPVPNEPKPESEGA